MSFELQEALFQSLIHAPLLCNDLDGIPSFDRNGLGNSARPLKPCELNMEQKLGHLYEDVLLYWIRASNRYSLIAQHQQVFDAQKRTLGELDFLLHDAFSEEHIHLEIAVKFYLAVKNADGWHYPGPDPRDHWLRKRTHLIEHQLRLSEFPEACELLQSKWQIGRVVPQHLIYGCIFRPIDQLDAPLPASIHPNCRTGQWLYLSDWHRHFPDLDEVRWVPKPYWPITLTDFISQQLPIVKAEVFQAKASQRAVLIRHPLSGAPCFVVPDSWSRLSA